MPRICQFTQKRTVRGHNVSHAKNRTKRTFLPNMQTKRFKLNGQTVTLRLTARAIRNIDKYGSLEAYLEHHDVAL